MNHEGHEGHEGHEDEAWDGVVLLCLAFVFFVVEFKWIHNRPARQAGLRLPGRDLGGFCNLDIAGDADRGARDAIVRLLRNAIDGCFNARPSG